MEILIDDDGYISFGEEKRPIDNDAFKRPKSVNNDEDYMNLSDQNRETYDFCKKHNLNGIVIFDIKDRNQYRADNPDCKK